LPSSSAPSFFFSCLLLSLLSCKITTTTGRRKLPLRLEQAAVDDMETSGERESVCSFTVRASKRKAAAAVSVGDEICHNGGWRSCLVRHHQSINQSVKSIDRCLIAQSRSEERGGWTRSDRASQLMPSFRCTGHTRAHNAHRAGSLLYSLSPSCGWEHLSNPWLVQGCVRAWGNVCVGMCDGRGSGGVRAEREGRHGLGYGICLSN
jgi:hypothetical protein